MPSAVVAYELVCGHAMTPPLNESQQQARVATNNQQARHHCVALKDSFSLLFIFLVCRLRNEIYVRFGWMEFFVICTLVSDSTAMSRTIRTQDSKSISLSL